ncbi:tripartite tricarboxylate transporter family receptor [mine drainage metagenome]|uniref:Tripartite tricarboxylate transporter family receptor n=1 Tax=mine drainage metagenome TaxID=410659 RepID=A0A1J5RF62_9ZZZZ
MNKLILTLLSALAVLTCTPAARATDFPTKTVTLVVPNAPGGAVDIMARLISQKLGGLWGKGVVVVYKPGAGTVLGTDYVAKSAPDGYTIGMVVTSHVINPSLRRNMPFDTLKDLSGVSEIATSQIVLEANPKFPANNLAELIALAKKEPGKLSFASPGAGSTMHLIGEMIKKKEGIDMLHVPFNGSGHAYIEVISGRIPLMLDPLFSSLPYIKSGKLKALAVAGAHRDPIAPNIPTIAETIPGFDVHSMFGLVVPSATPRDVVHKISVDVAKVLRMPDIQARMKEIGMTPLGTTPEQFDAYIRSEIPKWAEIVKSSGATVN